MANSPGNSLRVQKIHIALASLLDKERCHEARIEDLFYHQEMIINGLCTKYAWLKSSEQCAESEECQHGYVYGTLCWLSSTVLFHHVGCIRESAEKIVG